jgi:arylsulfatase A-like enzyme
VHRSGRVPPHVNQNNLNNDIEATSGVDLRFKFLAEKMREAGYSTAMIGKSHLGARSPANLPINRGFDVHFGFLKGEHLLRASAVSCWSC